MEHKSNHLTPEHILKMGTGFWASKILLSAVKFQLFTLLAEKKSMTAGEIKSAFNLNCTDRNVFDFLDALAAFGFLIREGILAPAKYSNSADTDFFLDRKKPSYVGGLLEMLNNRLYHFWGNLEEGLMTGKPQNETKADAGLFEKLYDDPDRLREFIHAMSGVQMGAFTAFAQKFDFSKYRTLADIGGASGLLSMMVAKNHAHISCTTWDLPPIAPIANETIEQFQLQDRVKAGSGDFFKDPLPAADIVVMGNILHVWDEPAKLILIKKAYDALPEGGALVVIENIIDDDRRENVFGLMMSLNMLIESGTGFNFTLEDFKGWANSTGFRSASLLQLAGPTSAAIAIK